MIPNKTKELMVCWKSIEEIIVTTKKIGKETIYVTWSGIITYFKVLRDVGFKYSVCWNSPMVEATST